MKEFRKVWGWNGPALLTRTWQSVTSASGNASSASFHNRVSIRPQHEFYAIPFSAADDYFSPLDSIKVTRWLKSFEVKPPRALHVWNKKLKGKMKGIGKKAAAAAAAAAVAGDGVNSNSSSSGSGGGDGGADRELEEELGPIEDNTSSSPRPHVPSFVEYLMRHACPAYLSKAHPALVTSVDALLKTPPVPPDPAPTLGKHALWLHWPQSRQRRVPWSGAGTEPGRARRTVTMYGGRLLSGDSDSGVTSASPPSSDDVCSMPGGEAWEVGCGASIPLPLTERQTYSWTVMLWFKVSPQPLGSSSDNSDPTALRPAMCPALACGNADCDTARHPLAPADPAAAAAGGGAAVDPRKRRRGRRNAASSGDGGSEFDLPLAPAAGSPSDSAAAEAGAVSFNVTHGKLQLRFPSGLLVPLTKVNVSTSSWRSVTIVYDSKQRRVPELGGRVARQSVHLYLDGLLVSTRHVPSVRLNASITPAALLMGRAPDADDASGSSGSGSPRVLLGGVTVFLGHLNEQAVLEAHAGDVLEGAAAAAAAAAKGVKC